MQSTWHRNNREDVHTPKPACEHEDVTMCNQEVHTDREVMANRTGKIIKNGKEKTCRLVSTPIPADRNVMQKEAEKN
jgi:hypothetical protein